MIEYAHFICPDEDLEDRLNELGKGFWRLHTCEPIMRQTPEGVAEIYAFVVMDRVTLPAEDQQNAAEDSETSEGIPMKG